MLTRTESTHRDPLIRLVIYLHVEHGMEVSFRSQAEPLDRLERALKAMGYDWVRDRLAAQVDRIRTRTPAERCVEIVEILTLAYRDQADGHPKMEE